MQNKGRKTFRNVFISAIVICTAALCIAAGLPAILTSAEYDLSPMETDAGSSGIPAVIQPLGGENADNEIYLIPGGQAFGVKFYTDGVMVVDMTAFETADGMRNPAHEAGIRIRDIIVSANGEKITTNADISAIVSKSGGKPIAFRIRRNESEFTVNVTPQKSTAQGAYKIGLWVRDSTAGIGTITYFNPQTGHFAGLGHGISDIDTGALMPLSAGDVIGANISSVIKGKKGAPGQLEGSFNESVRYGALLQNASQGIFGITDDKNILSQAALPIADREEIHTGEATIRCTTDGDEIQTYDVTIESVNRSSSSQGKNLVIRITDERLLEKTGGIVQGMSGSPIVQDGKIIGAVTHVLINDPTMGYGIFIENMLTIDNREAA